MVTAVALVAVVSLLVGAVTTVGMRAWLTDRLDREVQAAFQRLALVPAGVTPPGADDAGTPGRQDAPLRRGPWGRGGFGQQVGILAATFSADGDRGYVLADSSAGPVGVPLDDAALAALEGAGRGGAETVEVPGQGTYRVVSGTATGGAQRVVGLPTDDVDAATASLVRWELALALLGILVAAAAGSAVVRRQLRPLTEVAATANAVSELPLQSGEVGVTERVPEHLTDPQTEAGQVGLALNRLLAHVETSLSARHRSEQQVRQFVADASHELRTPLTTIAGYTELARRQGDPGTAQLALVKVEEEAGRMTALVEDLLLLARLDAGRPLVQERVDLSRLLVEAVEDARVVAPDHHWQIELPADGRQLEVTGDAGRLHQVVSNLLVNARRHTPPGTTVRVVARARGFDVHDDGPGFPADLVDSAFERFTRGDVSRHRSDGVGLGLALVRAIVAAHGGTVSLSSAPGRTVVGVQLPPLR
ncbi:cell wall metabolism sensor histidine kinase WalK [Nocardioides sp. J9]|uniref:sensor histidine kinase n=1 Tax=Nocardioides sp. J9 TaxID=935844 RepID=UPI0021BD22DA|nr:HAMP domain-containing sensor histidine kinase [Nocardioides sp. J9]